MSNQDSRIVSSLVSPSSGGLLSSAKSAGRGLLDFGRSVGGGLMSGARAVGQNIDAEQLQKDIIDTQRFYQQAMMSQPRQVLGKDLGMLKNITPAGIAASLPSLRAEEASALQKPMIEELEAMAALERAKGTGSVSAQKTSPKTYLTLDESGNKKIIETYFDKISGERLVSGTNESIPEGSMEIGAVDAPNLGFLNKLESSVYEDRDRLVALDGYLADVEGSGQGINNLIDRASLTIKTLINNKELTESELKTAKGQAKLQGLLGRFRVPIVGGGVMTEQDALRILSALGGDFDAFQNKRITKDLIAEIRKETAIRFDRESEKFNKALSSLPDVYYAKSIYKPVGSYVNPYATSPDGNDESGKGGLSPELRKQYDLD